MKGLFINLTAVNISGKKSSATFYKILFFVRIYKLR